MSGKILTKYTHSPKNKSASASGYYSVTRNTSVVLVMDIEVAAFAKVIRFNPMSDHNKDYKSDTCTYYFFAKHAATA